MARSDALSTVVKFESCLFYLDLSRLLKYLLFELPKTPTFSFTDFYLDFEGVLTFKWLSISSSVICSSDETRCESLMLLNFFRGEAGRSLEVRAPFLAGEKLFGSSLNYCYIVRLSVRFL